MNIGMITGLVRHILTFGGGYLVTSGIATADDVNAGVGAIVTLIGLVWSWLAKSDKNPIV